jgi:hypothetical protein
VGNPSFSSVNFLSYFYFSIFFLLIFAYFSVIGADIIAGGKVPIAGIVAAISHAASVLFNEKFKATSITIPTSLSLTNGQKTVLLVGATDSLVADAATSSSGLFHGAYTNSLCPEGVSALWNGAIGGASLAASKTFSDRFNSTPYVAVGGQTAVAVEPVNLAPRVSHIAFFDAKSPKSSSVLSKDEAVKQILDLTDDSKKDILLSLLGDNVTFSTVGKIEDATKILK